MTTLEPIVLAENESIGIIDCMCAPHQRPGHVGVSFVESLGQYRTVAEAEQWLAVHQDRPYVKITASIRIEKHEPGCTTISGRYQTLFSKDEQKCPCADTVAADM